MAHVSINILKERIPMKTFTSNLVILKNTSLSIAMIESYIIHWNTGKSSGTVGTTWHRKKIK